MNRDITSELKKLKSIKPNTSWQKQERAILLKQIEGTARAKSFANFFTCAKEIIGSEAVALMRPAASFAIVVLLIFGGGFFSISAASEATPGSFLYTFKLVSEKTQLKLAYRSEDKVKLGVKFAERRANEINSLVENNNHAEVETVAKTLSEEIVSVQNRLNEINSNDPSAALVLAQDIDTKTAKLRDTLQQVKTALASNTSGATKEINEAIRNINSTGLYALNTIVAAAKGSTDKTTQADVNKRVAAKIKTAKEQISNIESDTELVFSAGLGKSAESIELYQKPQTQAIDKTAAANKIIAEAEELFNAENYTEALNKINASQQLIDEAVEVVEQADQDKKQAEATGVGNQATTSPETVEIENVESQPQVKGVIELNNETGKASATVQGATSAPETIR